MASARPRPSGPDLFAPRAGIRIVEGNQVILDVRADRIHRMGCDRRPTTGLAAASVVDAGLAVTAADDEPRGFVTEIVQDPFQVHRGDAVDLAVPSNAVQTVQGNRAALTLPTKVIEFIH